jgi:hypothetical protein
VLLIREVALRTRRGWRGRLLLAAAFGVLMPTIVDGSLLTPVNPDIDYWDDIVGSTRVGRFSAYAVISWVTGHVVMSVGAPLVVVEALLPDGRTRPWLGRVGLAMLAVLGAGLGFLIHGDPDGGVVQATALDYGVCLAVILALIAAAMSPVGRPLSSTEGRRAGRPLLLGLARLRSDGGLRLGPISRAAVVLAGVVLVAAGSLLAAVDLATPGRLHLRGCPGSHLDRLLIAGAAGGRPRREARPERRLLAARPRDRRASVRPHPRACGRHVLTTARPSELDQPP